MSISQPIITFGLPGTATQGGLSQQGANFLSGYINKLHTVRVIQYDESEIVQDTLEHSILEPTPFFSSVTTFQVAQSTTPEILIPDNTPITSFVNNGLMPFVFVPTGIDLTCQPVTTAQKLVIHLNDITTSVTYENFELRQLTTDNLHEYIRFPKQTLLGQATNPLTVPLTSIQFSIKIFALAFGAQQIDVNVYWDAYAYTDYALPPLA